jgi:hypothetical protein
MICILSCFGIGERFEVIEGVKEVLRNNLPDSIMTKVQATAYGLKSVS